MTIVYVSMVQRARACCTTCCPGITVPFVTNKRSIPLTIEHETIDLLLLHQDCEEHMLWFQALLVGPFVSPAKRFSCRGADRTTTSVPNYNRLKYSTAFKIGQVSVVVT